MKKSLLLLGILILGFSRFASAQQDPQFTQYMFNQLYYNPAYSGMDNGTRFQLLGRMQWLGYNTSSDGSGGINTFVVSANAPWQAANSGVGFHAVIDRAGARQREEYQVSYAYHLSEIAGGKLSIGVRPGLYGERITGELRARDGIDADPVLRNLQGNPYSYRADLGAGLFWRSDKAHQWFIGLAANRLLGSTLNYGISDGTVFSNKSVPHVYLTSGITFDLSDDWSVTPQAMLRYITSTPASAATMVDVNAMVEYQKFLFGGLSYRTGSNDASIIVGANLGEKKEWRIIYAADVVNPAVSSATSGSSHELGLSYLLPFVPRPAKPAIGTPRFRF